MHAKNRCFTVLHKHDKLRPTQCCRAFTLALPRLSCFILHVRTPWASLS